MRTRYMYDETMTLLEVSAQIAHKRMTELPTESRLGIYLKIARRLEEERMLCHGSIRPCNDDPLIHTHL